jgi:hypothetical protein
MIVSYLHWLPAPSQPDAGGLISILSWLGIAGPTAWNRLDDFGIELAADTLYRPCAHFRESLPEWLLEDAVLVPEVQRTGSPSATGSCNQAFHVSTRT